MSTEDPYDIGDDFDPESETSAQEAAEIKAALTELATLETAAAERLVVELLERVENGELPLAALLGYTDGDLFDIYEKAYNLYKGGRPRQAAAICEGLLALSPELPAVQLLMAGCLMDLRQWEGALRLLDGVLEVDPEEREALLKRAHVLYRLRRLDEAAETLESLLQLDPERESDEAQEGERILAYVRALLSG
jgi:tetratricopeptide (TPR) repeat protein